MIVDFHSHILPEFDDGAKDIKMSLEMLELSRNMGVECVLATSHCYPHSSSGVEQYLEKREKSHKKLAENLTEDRPCIRLGTEVHLSTDLSKIRNIKKLCIDGTNYMLVEMPASPWNESIVECIYKLTLMGIIPIIAHAERNLDQKQDLLDMLYSFDVLIQINAESFGVHQFKGFIDKMMRNAMIHIVGTDMHNTKHRPPNMNKAYKYIKKRYGIECWDYLMENAEKVLEGKKLSYRDFKAFKKKKLFG